MSLNKTRKRLIRKLEDREHKLLSISESLRMFEEIILETRRANLGRLLVAGSPFRGGKVFDGTFHGGGKNGSINTYIRTLIACVARWSRSDWDRYVERRTRK